MSTLSDCPVHKCWFTADYRHYAQQQTITFNDFHPNSPEVSSAWKHMFSKFFTTNNVLTLKLASWPNRETSRVPISSIMLFIIPSRRMRRDVAHQFIMRAAGWHFPSRMDHLFGAPWWQQQPLKPASQFTDGDQVIVTASRLIVHLR